MRRIAPDALGISMVLRPEVCCVRPVNTSSTLRHVGTAFADTAAPFLIGDKFTSADILLTTCLDWRSPYGGRHLRTRHPYLERIRREPAYPRQGANVPLARSFRCSKDLAG